MIIGSLGSKKRSIDCKLGHSVGKAVSVEATIVFGRSNSNVRVMEVILGERNKEINEINDFLISRQRRSSRFGSKGSLMMQSWMTEKTSGDGEFKVTRWSSIFILRAYFRKRTHSVVVGSLLKDFRTESSRKEKTHVVGALTACLSSSKTSLGKDMSNGSS